MDERRDKDRKVDQADAEMAERRFNETVWNLLNTPPKPHKHNARGALGKLPPQEKTDADRKRLGRKAKP